jgi:hypothetical protein
MTPWWKPKDRCHRQASASINESLIRGTTAGSATFRSHAMQQRLPPALREAQAIEQRNVCYGSRLCQNSKTRSATRMIFLNSTRSIAFRWSALNRMLSSIARSARSSGPRLARRSLRLRRVGGRLWGGPGITPGSTGKDAVYPCQRTPGVVRKNVPQNVPFWHFRSMEPEGNLT